MVNLTDNLIILIDAQACNRDFTVFIILHSNIFKLAFLFLNQNVCCSYSKAPRTNVKTDGLENIHDFMIKYFVDLDLWVGIT